MHRDAGTDPGGSPGEETHLDQLRGAAESYDADTHAALHASHRWVLKEVGESHRGLTSIHVLQADSRRTQSVCRLAC